jgi:cytochrome c oxidase subunit 3
MLVLSFLLFKIRVLSNFFYGVVELTGYLFIQIQLFEYFYSNFTFRDSVFGSLFFFITGFHGFHVFFGLFFLLKNHYNLIKFFFGTTHCLRYEFGIFY